MQIYFLKNKKSFDKRKTLYYVHFYPFQSNKEKQNNKMKEDMKRESKDSLNNKRLKYNSQNQQKTNILIPDFMKKEMLLSKQTLLPYDETHVNCERHFLYFTSRLAIIYNPLSKTQRFYQGHRYKITCISVHPSSFIQKII